jgi:uncharacterized membrane protein YhaH (DUF805 family)
MKNDSYEAFGLTQTQKPDYFERRLVKILFPLGGFLVGATGLLTSTHNLPAWALAVLVCFVAICALVLLWPPVDWSVKRLHASKKRSRAATLYYAEVEQKIRRLYEQSWKIYGTHADL